MPEPVRSVTRYTAARRPPQSVQRVGSRGYPYSGWIRLWYKKKEMALHASGKGLSDSGDGAGSMDSTAPALPRAVANRPLLLQMPSPRPAPDYGSSLVRRLILAKMAIYWFVSYGLPYEVYLRQVAWQSSMGPNEGRRQSRLCHARRGGYKNFGALEL